MAGSLNAQAIANLVVHVGLDDSKVSVGLKAMQNSVRAATTQWRAQFAIFNQLGDHVGAAKSKYDGLTESIKRQNNVVDEQRSQLKAMGQRTSENAASYDKLTAQINLNANKLASLVEQQQKAGRMYEFEKTGIRDNKQELSLLQREMESTVKMYRAQGKEQEANQAKAKGLRAEIEQLTEIQSKEQTLLERIKTESGENSREYRQQAIRVNELAGKIGHTKNEFNDLNEAMAKKPRFSFSSISKSLDGLSTRAEKTRGIFAKLIGANLVASGIIAGFTRITSALHQAGEAGSEYNKQQQVMNATWKTLTDSAKKGKAMVDSVNQMSVAFGQSADLVNELDQQFYHVFENQPRTEKLTKSVLTLGDTLGMSAADLQRLGLNFTHMLGSGMMQLEDFNNITDQLPMYGEQLLEYERKVQKNSKLTMAELRKEMSAGKISAKDAEAVMESLGDKYAKASENMMKTLPGMERIVKSRVPALIGAFQKPFQKAQADLFGVMSKWVSSGTTEKEFSKMGDAASKGMTTILNAFGKVFGSKGATHTADAAVNALTKGITRFSNFIADHAGDIVKFFNKAKEQAGAFATTFADTFKKVGPAVSETAKTLNKVLKPVLNLIAEHPKQFAELATGMLLMNKAMSLLNPALSLAGKGFSATSKSIAYMRSESTIGHKAVTGLGKGIKGIGKWSGTAITSSIKGVGSAAKDSAKWVGSLSKSFLTKAKAVAIAAGQKIITSATKAWTFAQKALNLALKANPIGLIITAVGLLVTGFVALYKHNEKFRDFVNGIWSNIKKIFGSMGKWFKGIWNGITDGVKKFAGGIKDKFGDMKKGVSDHAKKMANAAKDKFNDMKKWSVDATKKMADQVADKHSWLNKHTNGAASTMFTGLKKTFKNGHRTMEDATQTFKDLIHGKWSKLGSDMKKTSKSAMGTVKSYFKTGYNTLNDLTGGRLGDMLDKVKSIGGKIVDYFKKLPHRMASGIKNGWDAIKQAFVDLGNGMLSGIGKGVNGVIGGINWVLGKVHAPKIKKWDVPQYAKGGSAQGLAIVGEKGKHELIKHPDGRIEVSPNKATLYNFKQPVRILGGDKTESLMKAGIIPQFGVGNWLGSAMDFVKGGFSAISKGANSFWNAVTHPSQLLATAVDKFTDLSGLSGTIADMAKGTVTYATKEALNWIKEKLTLADEPGGSGVERWRPYVIRALSMNDLSTSGSMVSKVLRQIATESGGNPHAVQHGYTDVNTLSGDLAKGLMQTISATFNAYKFSGHGNIFSGFDNLLAALNYAKHRYGPSLSALGKGHGYANGAIVSTEQYAHIAEGNKPEAIIPLTNTNRAIQLMYQVLDYLSGDSSRSENGNDKNNDNSALISLIGQLINKSERTNQLLELIAQKNTTIKLNSRVLAEAVNREFTKQVRDDAIMG